MRERAEEIRNINQGMHQVNEIYKVRFGYIKICSHKIYDINTLKYMI